MPGSARLLARATTLALIGWIGCATGVRPASAMGCHAPDRPSLGLSLVREAPDDLGLARVAFPARPAPRLMPKPCPGEVPAAPERPAPGDPAADVARWAPPIGPWARRVEIPDSPASSRHHPSRPERPPRPPAR